MNYSDRHLLRYLRDQCSAEQNHRCCYCGVRTIAQPSQEPHAATLDHVVSKAWGGEDIYENCVMSCKKCNEDKSMGWGPHPATKAQLNIKEDERIYGDGITIQPSKQDKFAVHIDNKIICNHATYDQAKIHLAQFQRSNRLKQNHKGRLK